MSYRPPFGRYSGSRKIYDKTVKTVCQECSVCCGLQVYLKDGNIVDIQGDEFHPVSRGRVCNRGLAFHQGSNHQNRITQPWFRKKLDDVFEPLETWENGLDLAAEQLRKIKDQYGPEAIVIVCDREAGLDFGLGAGWFAKWIATPHLFYSYAFPAAAVYPSLPAYPAVSCPDWVHSKSILFVENDMAATHPVSFGWALEAKQKGAKIIAADPCFNRTLSKADICLRSRPQSANFLGLALMKAVLEERLQRVDPGKGYVKNLGRWMETLEKCSWEQIETRLGLAPAKIKHVAQLLSQNGPAVIVTGPEAASRPAYGVWRTLALSMGWFGVQGGGWYALDATLPPWDLQADQNAKLHQTLAVKELSSAKAVIYSGNGFDSLFPFLKESAAHPELIVHFGSFPNDVQAQSHLVLPAAFWFEKSGLCFSNDRAVYWSPRIVEPRAACGSGLHFWAGLIKRFGGSGSFPGLQSDGTIQSAAFHQALLDQSTATKEYHSAPHREAAEVVLLGHWSRAEEKAEAIMIDPEPIDWTLPQPADEAFPFAFQKIALVSRSGEASRWWPWTRELEPEEVVQINPATAQMLGIENGEEVLVAGATGRMASRAWLTRMVPKEIVASYRSTGDERVAVYKKNKAV